MLGEGDGLKSGEHTDSGGPNVWGGVYFAELKVANTIVFK